MRDNLCRSVLVTARVKRKRREGSDTVKCPK